MPGVFIENTAFNDADELTIKVKGTFSSGGHSVKHDVIRQNGFVTRVIISVSSPGGNSTCVMQYIDETITVKGPFDAAVTLEGPMGAPQVLRP